MIKKEAPHMRRRMECNLHGMTLRYRCVEPTCSQPLLCPHSDCLDAHFHHPTLTITRFDNALWESRLLQAHNVLTNDSLTRKQASLEAFIKSLACNMANISEEMIGFQRIKEKISTDSPNQPITSTYLDSLNGFLCLSSQLERKLDALRAKINEEEVPLEQSSSMPPPAINVYPPPQKAEQLNECYLSEGRSTVSKNDVSWQKDCLSGLLARELGGFSWQGTEIVWDSTMGSTTCERFHEKLRGKERLLFIFVGQNGILLGSYYEAKYPSTMQKNQQDPKSFIFIEDDETPGKMTLFRADPSQPSHITVSERLLICHGNTPNYGDGLRTFQRTFESIAYFLPSKSYRLVEEQQSGTAYNGMLKTKQFVILQVKGGQE